MTETSLAKQDVAAVGRPTTYKPEYADLIRQEADANPGASLASLALKIGTYKGQLAGWAEQNPEFLDALNYARTVSETWWAQQLQDSIGDKGKNCLPIFFGLKCQHKWIDRPDVLKVEHSGTVKVEIHKSYLSIVEVSEGEYKPVEDE